MKTHRYYEPAPGQIFEAIRVVRETPIATQDECAHRWKMRTNDERTTRYTHVCATCGKLGTTNAAKKANQ